jgi:hypothetical protein
LRSRACLRNCLPRKTRRNAEPAEHAENH